MWNRTSLILCLITNICLAQNSITFNKQFHFGTDGIVNIIEDSTNYIGIVNSGFPVVPSQYTWLKLDSNGNAVSTKTYFDSTKNNLLISFYKADTGYVSIGFAQETNPNFYTYGRLIFFDSDGDTTLTVGYYPPQGYHYFIANGIPLDSGGYLLSGQVVDSANNNADLIVIRVDSIGNVVWTQTWGGPLFEAGRYGMEISDGFIIVGYTYSFGALDRDALIIKFDKSGNFLWYKKYGGNYLDYANQIIKLNDSSYLVSGYKGLLSSSRLWLIKIDSVGNLIWNYEYGNNYSECWQSCQDSSGNIISAGYLENFSNNQPEGYVFKTDSVGTLIWDRKFPLFNNFAMLRSIRMTSDNGFISSGFCVPGGVNGQDAWVLKLDSDGCDSVGCPTVYTSLNEIDNEISKPILIYPNPVTDILTIESMDNFQLEDITVFDIQGKKQNIAYTGTSNRLDVVTSGLAPGVYFLSVRTNLGFVFKKFFKM